MDMKNLRGFNSKITHDKMVEIAVQHYRNKGHQGITADISGYSQPAEIFWKDGSAKHIPDILTNKVVAEVETADSINSEHTASQLKLFAAYARQHSLECHLIVPQSGYADALQVKTKLNLQNLEVYHI